MTMLKPLDAALQEASSAIEGASNRELARLLWNRWDGVLTGYYLAGAVSSVEAQAAHGELRRTFQAVDAAAQLREEWQRDHHDSYSDAADEAAIAARRLGGTR